MGSGRLAVSVRGPDRVQRVGSGGGSRNVRGSGGGRESQQAAVPLSADQAFRRSRWRILRAGPGMQRTPEAGPERPERT